MNEQELMKLVEEASTEEEVWKIVSEAGMDKETIDTIMAAAETSDDEISDADLENVSGGFLSYIVVGIVGVAVVRKIQKIRKQRYQLGYDEEIMSDNRLSGTCENKK